MNIYYNTKKLERILEDHRLIKKYYTSCHLKLVNRLAELMAATTLEDISNLPPPRRHKLTGDKINCWGIDITKNYRIVIMPSGHFDINKLSTITEIMIVDIEDYH